MSARLRSLALVVLLAAAAEDAGAAGDATRGRYLAAAGGCAGCHTDNAPSAVPFAGGRAIPTPFGTFYGPNITAHPQAGIGRWSETDFIRAMREGVRPDGAHYYPAFPYPSFTRIVDGDLRDLWAYLRTLPPSDRANRSHELHFPFGWRFTVAVWKWLYFTPGPYVTDGRRAPAVDRGAYLVEALGHCGECHTPRNLLGGSKRDRRLAGATIGGKSVPNLTPTRLGKWTDAELKEFLLTGITPEFDSADEAMAEIVRNTTSRLAPEDLAAVIAYLRALPALPDERR